MESTSNDEPLEETFYVRTQEHWKALSHPLRLAIIRLLRERAMTNEELAHALDVASGKLYFHTRQLLEAGMIHLAGTRQKQAITEKLYRAVSRRFRVANLLDFDEESHIEADEIESAIQLYRNTLSEYPDLFATDRHLVDHSLFLLPPQKAEELQRKLCALIQEAMDAKTVAPDSVPVALTVLLYPLPGARNNSSEKESREQL
jgi:DNA-binding transcriptional ArsR family regulator